MKEKSNLSYEYIKLSKFLSFVLRHHPEQYNLELDEEGFVSLDDLMNALKNTRHSWAEVEDVEKIISEGERRRFEIKRGKIRALYGHSVRVKIEGSFCPKGTLYHGTSPEKLSEILSEGLSPMERQFVHLSKDKETAFKVGERHHPNPIILEIDAEEAFKNGVEFFDKDVVILSNKIPPEFIKPLE
ncbi:MAG: RNA 2'-phosphotransferase [candidate division WOR-3 bacterium]|jgi:putative RNA 2'-phosphotransferase